MECAIQKRLGSRQECTGASCPFWETAEGATPDGCLVERRLATDLNNQALAAWLIGLRHTLECIRIDQGRLP
jgi:hypothetical protein